jgi:ribonuclease HII
MMLARAPLHLARSPMPPRPSGSPPRRPARATSTRTTLGIDEAGRGPAVGPMVIAAVALDTQAATALTRAGLSDSKSFGAGDDAHAVRCELAKEIRARARFVMTIEVEHTEIDARVLRNELNVLERELAVRLIERANEELAQIDRIIADGKRMFQLLGQRFERFESHDRAEEKHASVAAASVVAKVIRDERFAQIRSRYEQELGPITGGGYANAATRRWLRAYCERYGRLPEECRLSWPHPYVEDLIGQVGPPAPQLSLI